MKKAYAKVKAQELENTPTTRPAYLEASDDENGKEEKTSEDVENDENDEPTTTEPAAPPALHPDRQTMLDRAQDPNAAYDDEGEDVNGFRQVQRQREQAKQERREARRCGKPSPFAKETKFAEKKRLEAEARQKQREFRQKDREAMARARRPDQNGKRRLGRESTVLLERVKRMVGEA